MIQANWIDFGDVIPLIGQATWFHANLNTVKTMEIYVGLINLFSGKNKEKILSLIIKDFVQTFIKDNEHFELS